MRIELKQELGPATVHRRRSKPFQALRRHPDPSKERQDLCTDNAVEEL
jgi:hypothetical protein